MFQFKSVFIKYMATFLLINIISFFILSSTISAVVNSYGSEMKSGSLSNAANSVSAFIESDYPPLEKSFRNYLMTRSQNLKTILQLLVVNDATMLIFITDNTGQVIHFGGSENVSITTEATSNGTGRYYISEDSSDRLLAGMNVSAMDDMNGFFRTPHVYYAIPLYNDGTYIGAVFAASSDTGTDALIGTMNKTLIMSILWIMMASLIAAYFITERLIAPIKEISRAAKSFADGSFDARVTVVGDDEIAELASSFNNMASSLQNMEDMRRSFLANVSHDLRTPMTTISGFIDGILDGAIPPEQQDYYLEIIATEVRRLSRLVSQLLDISRLEAGERQFHPQVYDICEQGREIIISNIQRLEDKKLDVQFVCDADNMFVYADKDAIHQIFYNICDNAIKFSSEGGLYEISIKQKDRAIHVSVFNEGQGIPKEDLPFIFERFYKSDKSRGVDKTGVGLGLYIARTIIESQGQRIWVESEAGKWCRFTFTLALGKPDKPKIQLKNEQKNKEDQEC